MGPAYAQAGTRGKTSSDQAVTSLQQRNRMGAGGHLGPVVASFRVVLVPYHMGS